MGLVTATSLNLRVHIPFRSTGYKCIYSSHHLFYCTFLRTLDHFVRLLAYRQSYRRIPLGFNNSGFIFTASEWLSMSRSMLCLRGQIEWRIILGNGPKVLDSLL